MVIGGRFEVKILGNVFFVTSAGWQSLEAMINEEKLCLNYMVYGCFQKSWYLQNIHLYNRVFHYFYHPFCFFCRPIFGNTHILLASLDLLQEIQPVDLWERLVTWRKTTSCWVSVGDKREFNTYICKYMHRYAKNILVVYIYMHNIYIYISYMI